MNALCISPGCSKEALSIDAGWVACEEHERSKAHDTPTEFARINPDLALFIHDMRRRRIAECWHEQERPAWIPTRKVNPWDPPNENRRRTDG